MSIIEVNNVTKEFQLGQLKSLKHTVLNSFDRLRGKEVEKPQPFKALDDVSFRVEPGEVLGIIGQNGAGKSTLLKMLTRISRPTRGEIKVNGTVAPLIEVGAGLIGDLTGRENIFLNGAILGLSQAEIRKKFDEIVEFAELEQFIDTPIKRYSSGMAVRLGFAIATSVDADILIVDEVLAVGDLAFQRKCFDRMEEMIKRQGKTVLLVSHNIRQVERLCSRAILLNHGKIVTDDKPQKVCDLYYELNDSKIYANNNSSTQKVIKHNISTGEVELLDLVIKDICGNKQDAFEYNSTITVNIKIKNNILLDNVTFGVGVHTTDLLYLTTHNSEQQLIAVEMEPGVHEIICKIVNIPLSPGVYSLRLGITAGKVTRTVYYAENLYHFQIVTPQSERLSSANRDGFFLVNANWSINIDQGDSASNDRYEMVR